MLSFICFIFGKYLVKLCLYKSFKLTIEEIIVLLQFFFFPQYIGLGIRLSL